MLVNFTATSQSALIYRMFTLSGFVAACPIYDTFGYQSYITPKKKIGNDRETFQAVKRKSPILNNVEQWVIKIKMAPEMTITSVLNNAMAMANSCL